MFLNLYIFRVKKKRIKRWTYFAQRVTCVIKIQFYNFITLYPGHRIKISLTLPIVLLSSNVFVVFKRFL